MFIYSFIFRKDAIVARNLLSEIRILAKFACVEENLRSMAKSRMLHFGNYFFTHKILIQ